MKKVLSMAFFAFSCMPLLASSDSTLRLISETGTKTVQRVTAKSNSTPSAANVAFAVAPIKSAWDLLIYQKMTPAKESPFNLLSPNARRQFLESLDFNERGVTGFKYSILEEELTPTQIFRVLALLGSQSNTAQMVHAEKANLNDTMVMQSAIGGSGYCGFEVRCPPSPRGGGPFNEGGGGFEWPNPMPSGPYERPDGDYMNYFCFDRATCRVRDSFICKNSC